MKKIFLIFAVTLLFYYCYDNGVQLEAKEVLSSAETDSSYVDSDYLYGSSVLTIRDYYEDYYKNRQAIDHDFTEKELYLNNIDDYASWFGSVIDVGQSTFVYNKVQEDNLITSIVPKKYFTKNCDEVIVGNEYGFYVKTTYLPSEYSNYGNYDGYDFEVVDHRGFYDSYVFLFDIEYNIEYNKVSITPLFDGYFRTSYKYILDTELNIYNASGDYVVYPHLVKNLACYNNDNAYISNVMLYAECENASDIMDDNVGTSIVGVQSTIPIAKDMCKSDNIESGLDIASEVASVISSISGYASLIPSPVSVALDKISTVSGIVSDADTLVRLMYLTYNDMYYTDIEQKQYDVVNDSTSKIIEKASSGKLTKSYCFIAGEYSSAKDVFNNYSFKKSIDINKDINGNPNYNTISAEFDYSEITNTNNLHFMYLKPTNYTLGFSFTLFIDDSFGDSEIAISGSFKYSYGDDKMTYENYESEILPLGECRQFIIEPEYDGEYLFRINANTVFELYNFSDFDTKPLISNRDEYVNGDYNNTNVICYDGTDIIISLDSDDTYILYLAPSYRLIYDTSYGYYAGVYKKAPISYSFSLTPIIDIDYNNSYELDIEGTTTKLYYFKPETNGLYKFRTYADEGNIYNEVTLFDENMKIINTDTCTVEDYLSSSSEYFIGVSGFTNLSKGHVTLEATMTADVITVNASNEYSINIDQGSNYIYSFIPAETCAYNFETYSSIDMYLTIYDANWNVLVKDDDSGTNNNARTSTTLYAGAKYYISVKGYNANVSGSAKFIISTSAKDSQNISLDGRNIKYYLYEPTEYSAFMVHTNSNYDTYMYLYDENLNQITYNDDSGVRLNAKISYTFALNTRYYIGIRAYSSSVSGTATLKIEKELKDTQTVTINGKTIMLFAYIPTTTGQYSFDTTSSYDTYMYLYDANMNQITYDDDSGIGANSCISITLSSDTLYYVGVRAYSSSVTGNVTLRIVRDLKASQSVNLDGRNIVVYSFTPTATRSYYIQTTGSYDTYMYLYDANMNQIAYDDDGGDSLNAAISITLSRGTKYYIGVSAYSVSLKATATLRYS